MKIYFLASVAADEQLRLAFKDIISLLQKEGQVVNAKESLTSPKVIKSISVKKNEIRAKKLMRTMISSDCIVFEGTHPTTGGGYYLSLALQKNIPVLFLSQEEYRGLCLASYNRLLKIEKYSPDNKVQLEKVIKSFIKFAKRKGEEKRFNLMINEDIRNFLSKTAKVNGISKADLIRSYIYSEMEKSK